MARLDVPQEVAGYRLGRKLGEGGQADVYLGENAAGSQAAVKLYRPMRDAHARCAKEIQVLRRVPAEYAARLLESGEANGRPYLVTEYIEGDTLRDRLEELPAGADGLRRLDPAGLRQVALGSITALAAFHEHGVVHRDFKPANVICTADRVHVIDFGIAHRVGDATTVWNGPVGTVAYMSPEQFAPGRAGFSSDVFSWAVVMVHAATGRHPFRDEDDDADRVIERIRTQTPDLAAFPRPWRSLLKKCLHKRPNRRPAAGRVREAVASLDGPVLAVPAARRAPRETVPDPRTRPDVRPARWSERPVAGLALGAVLAGTAWAGAVLAGDEDTGCPQPLVLRAMVPAELREELHRAGQDFAAAEAGDGCRPVQVTVSAQPSLEALRSGLAAGWADRLGTDPQPDVLLMSSSAEKAYVDSASAEGEAPPGARPPKLVDLGSTGERSAMSVAATAAAWDVLDAERRDGRWNDLPGLLERAEAHGIGVLRPNPDSAASGTLGSLGFYADPAVNGDEERLNAFERQVARVPIADAGTALCALEERSQAVAIVPERVVDAHNAASSSGRSTGCGTGRRPTTFPLLQVDGLHRLDYPLVHVVWPGERAAERAEYAERFRDRLAGRASGGDWPRGSVPLEPGALAGTQDLLKRTRGGRTFEVLVDRSGSMERDAPGGVPLVAVRALTGDLLGELREHDRIGLAAFPEEGGRDPVELLAHGPAGVEEVLAVRARMEGLEAEEVVTPLHRAIAVRGSALNSADPEGVLVVFTDGVDEDVSEAAAREAAADMGAELGRQGAPRVVVVVLGGRRCADGVKAMDERFEDFVCVAAGRSSYEDLRARLFVEIWR
ncbi:protein kinase domain-containing protein [Actinocorallia populi]|uniref:protein kinase domain-containing protein n=1 Tax=Actinocorallia populi TaxID=2079200 RepID=UPI0018E4F105|nr:protein kinase [Actinocorallia populi]